LQKECTLMATGDTVDTKSCQQSGDETHTAQIE
jgi:hypothetical protein